MRMKKYLVREMPEAIAQIRRDLGRDAVILSTRPVTRRTRFGLRQERWIEVTAGVGPDLPGLGPPPPDTRLPMPDLRQLQEDIERLRRFIEGQSEAPATPPADDRASALLRRVPQRPGLGESARIIAFIGPTGVGKTTTIAKIAALQVLSGKRRVGLVSADTFRIAAVDQLRTYAEILGVPMAVAARPEEAESALAAVRHCDLVLVDTTGRSYARSEHVEDTRRWMQALHVDEIHLVLAMTAKTSDLLRVARTLEPVRFDKFLLTKLDETSSVDGAMELLWEIPRPVSYVTNGQNVPDDIEVADLDGLVRQARVGQALAGA
ncbi:MAG: flagellar biosynthesis protein FlhF [Thermoflavifilum sp.]|nr:flagellar biosynthesis protein FlhF [Thermoflavifilum sp.]MCL6513396.1 flagellar biosynthesis protein FlhF [Alicyclobacillus sp.]